MNQNSRKVTSQALNPKLHRTSLLDSGAILAINCWRNSNTFCWNIVIHFRFHYSHSLNRDRFRDEESTDAGTTVPPAPTESEPISILFLGLFFPSDRFISSLMIMRTLCFVQWHVGPMETGSPICWFFKKSFRFNHKWRRKNAYVNFLTTENPWLTRREKLVLQTRYESSFLMF